MRFTCSIDLNVTSAKAAVVYSDRRGKKHWIRGLQSHELLSGEGGLPEARSRIVIKRGNSVSQLYETIRFNRLPTEHKALYQSKYAVYIMTTRFIAIGDSLCRYECDINYTRYIGLLPKLIIPFLLFRFKKQTLATMLSFKEYVENEKPGLPD